MNATRGTLQLMEEFERAAVSAAATVERVGRDARQIAAAVERFAPDAPRIIVAEPRELPATLFAACRALPGALTGRAKSELAGCDLGITEAFAGVARTGSLCVSVDHEYSGYASLLARVHVALLGPENIVERPGDLFRAECGGLGLRGNFVFVTGPSATADMGPLVRGVHGPHKLHILILGPQ
jgi:L-lactate dehydrogenase complex protein LldG